MIKIITVSCKLLFEDQHDNIVSPQIKGNLWTKPTAITLPTKRWIQKIINVNKYILKLSIRNKTM